MSVALLLDALNAYPVVSAGLFGLVIGSFLNVVIHRLPLMMQRQWDADIEQYRLEQADPNPTPSVLPTHNQQPAFNLMKPGSHCPQCNNKLAFWHNIPVLSYLLLRGQCHFCHAGIGVRYPMIELLTGGLFALLAHQLNGFTVALPWFVFLASLICLAAIDLDTFLLPDDITLPLLWLGLLFNLVTQTIPLSSAVLGAVFGYLSLWTIYKLFKLLTGKEGMGYGDFKLLAAMGAWFGWESLLFIVLVSSLLGAVIGIALLMAKRQDKNHPIPFGPWLVLGGLAWLYDYPGRNTLVYLMQS